MPKILVADDSITVRKVAERLLTEAGLEVALAASGEEALAWLANETPDFIVTDVIMPDKSGYDVCKFVKSHAVLSGTPVLLISGIVNEDVTRKAESCRADGVLKKPFQGASLQDRVLELLAKRGDKIPVDSVHSAQEAVAAEPSSASHESLEQAPISQSVEGSVTPENIQDPAAPPATAPHASQKVFRITEEQLHGFRQSAGRIKELETLLQDEKTRADRLVEQVEAAQQTARRLHEMEAALADREQRSAEEALRGQAHEALESRNKELTATLTEQQQRISELTDQLNRFTGLESLNKELEASVEDLRARLSRAEHDSSTGKSNGDGVPRLQALISEQHQRLSELADQVIRYSEAETKIKALETSLENEQSRANDMAQRCAELEHASAGATMRLEDMTKLLAQIARLARPEEHQNSASS
ncbi:MAG TPA: response regulator [Nitrospiraceae bacterium]|nr:response regulator [Nitrospiraceae bacterium]